MIESFCSNRFLEEIQSKINLLSIFIKSKLRIECVDSDCFPSFYSSLSLFPLQSNFFHFSLLIVAQKQTGPVVVFLPVPSIAVDSINREKVSYRLV